MEDNVIKAINLVEQGHPSFFKFLSANEAGSTGSHQCGLYVPRDFAEKIFGRPCVKGSQIDAKVDVIWDDAKITKSRFVYYGQKSRNESRLTCFGRGFQYLAQEYVGALVVFVKENASKVHTFVFNSDEEIEEFLGALGLGPTDANRLINLTGISPEDREKTAFDQFIATLTTEFPSSEEMSAAARKIEDAVYDHKEEISTKPDAKLLKWADVEYRLFRAIENDRFGATVSEGFETVEAFVEMANKVLNRRKSRAGKSLEHHLSALFTGNGLAFEEQVVTEGSKKPDFIFPSSQAYHDQSFPTANLIFLAAKTTCKDRWRQILNEANRLKDKPKYLCTLQQGISLPQMNEMAAEGVRLVVPRDYINYYPAETRSQIMNIGQFVSFAKGVQGVA